MPPVSEELVNSISCVRFVNFVNLCDTSSHSSFGVGM